MGNIPLHSFFTNLIACQTRRSVCRLSVFQTQPEDEDQPQYPGKSQSSAAKGVSTCCLVHLADTAVWPRRTGARPGGRQSDAFCGPPDSCG